MDYKKLVKVTDGELNTYIQLMTGRDGYSPDQVDDSSITVDEFIDLLWNGRDDTKVYFNNDNGYTFGSTNDCVSWSKDGKYVFLNTTRDGYSIDQVGSTMTVAEMVDELNNTPSGDAIILFKNDNGYTYGYIDEDRVREREIEAEFDETLSNEYDLKMEELSDKLDFVWYGGSSSSMSNANRLVYRIETYGLAEDVDALKEQLIEVFGGLDKVSVKDYSKKEFFLIIKI